MQFILPMQAHLIATVPSIRIIPFVIYIDATLGLHSGIPKKIT
jgi:hypothetical protein